METLKYFAANLEVEVAAFNFPDIGEPVNDWTEDAFAILSNENDANLAIGWTELNWEKLREIKH